MASQGILQNLCDHLKGSSLITAIVGSSAEARVFINTIPQEGFAEPFVWLQRSLERREVLLDGTYSRIIETQVDIECVNTTYATADALASHVKTRLRAVTPHSTMGSDPVLALTYEDQSDAYVRRNASDSKGFHIPAIGVTIWHTT